MGKIVGEKFRDYVKDQIFTRQQKLGQLTSQDNDYYTWVTNRQPWIRLCSSIDISEDKRTELGLSETYTGDGLAKNYILYGGVVGLNDQGKISTLKGGISNSLDKNNLNNPKAYGFNSSEEFGFEPLPSITNINIVPKNRGSLTEATIKIHCHNVDQFNIIETLFLRLKYSILLEWGFNVYYNNQGELITTPTDTVYQKFLKGNIDKNTILNKIEKQRKNSSGNYDGFYGWVTNFNWSLTEHGGYDIELKAITLGDVIESVKMTSSPSSPEATNDKSGYSDVFLGDEHPAYKNTVLANILQSFITSTRTSTPDTFKLNKIKNPSSYIYYDSINGSTIKSSEIDTKLELEIGATDRKNITDAYYADDEFIFVYYNSATNDASEAPVVLPSFGGGLNNVEQAAFNAEVLDSQLEKGYLKLGALLRIMQDILYLRDQNKNSISKFDFNYDTNFCYNPSNMLLSLDPSVCIVPQSVFQWSYDGDWSWLCNTDEWNSERSSSRSKVMHLYISTDFILSCIDQNIDQETGETNAIDFLKSILSGINDACGNVIDLNLVYEEYNNTYYVIDENYIEDDIKVTEFNVTSLKKGNGSFIKKIDTKCQISPALATTIAIGAQASRTSASDSLPFANWNAGLTDRILKEKNTVNSVSNSNFNKDIEWSALQDNLNECYFDATKTRELIPSYKRVIEAYKEDNPPNSFIPLNLSLEMEGLSGMKLFQSYAITEKYLPKNYKNNIIFIIKGISHNINVKEWTTNIEGLSIPKPPNIRVESTPPVPKNNNNSGNQADTDLQDFVDNIQKQEADECIAAVGNQSTEDRVRIIAKFFKDKGLSLNATLGILGNMLEEAGSKLEPWAGESGVQSVNAGVGLIQWSNDSKKDFVAAYNAQDTYTWCNMDFQLNYIWDSELSTMNTFKNYPNQTIAEYTEYFWAEVEKPSAFTKYAPYKTNPVAGGGFEAYRIPITDKLLYINYAKDALEATEMATRKTGFERSLNERVVNASKAIYKNIVQEVYNT